MAGIKISALPAAPSAQLTDVFPVVQGGVTFKESNTQLLTLFQSFPGGAGGSDTQIQYNDSGILAGDGGFTTDGSGTLVATTSVTVANVNLASNIVSVINSNGNLNLRGNGTGGVLISPSTTVPEPFSAGLDLEISTARAGGTGLGIYSWNSSVNNGPGFVLARSKSAVINVPSTVVSGDLLGYMDCVGDDGTSFASLQSGSIECRVDNTVSAGIVPGRWDFYTTTVGGASTLGMSLSSAQILTLAHALPVGSGGLGITTVPSNGFLPIGNGTNYVAAAITAGTGISVTNGAGTITLAVSSQILTWAANASSSISAAVGNGYILTSGSPTTVTLPTTFAVGTRIGIAGQGAAWTMAIGAATNVKAFGNTYTTSFASTNNTDTIELVATVANTTWAILSMSTTGFTAS